MSKPNIRDMSPREFVRQLHREHGEAARVTELGLRVLHGELTEMHSPERMISARVTMAAIQHELAAAAELDAWGPRGPSASYAEWLAEGREPEPEAGP